MERMWRRWAATVSRHPRRVLVAAALVVAVLGAGVTGLAFVTGQETLVDAGSEVYEDNARFQDRFGGEPMLILLTGDIRTMATGDRLAEIQALEEDLRATGEFDAVVGPATALDFAVGQVAVAPDMFVEASDRDATAPDRLAAETARLAAAGEPSLDNPAYVDFLLFDGQGEIRPGLRDNFLDRDHALVIVRLPGNASIEQQAHGAAVVDEVVARRPIAGVEALASGPPELLAEINDYLQGGMATLGAIAVGVMVVVLLLVFRARWPLLPLAVVVVGAVGAFGAVGAAGIPLTLVTISGLPILIGLGVDFAIQMHNRFEEERADGRTPEAATDRTYRHMAPPLSQAMVAAVAGFVALRWSDVPMIRDFGLLLSVGVVVLVAVALATTVPILVLRDRRRSGRPPRGTARRMEAAVRRVSSLPARAAVPVLLVGLVVVGAGFVVEGGLAIQTDPERWVDQDGTAVTDLEALREGTGFSSELSILVEADDVTAPTVAAWMQRFGAEAVDRHPELLRATSMAALATGVHGTAPGGDDIDRLLAVAPDDAARVLIGPDRTTASLVFPIAPVTLAQREQLLGELAGDLRNELAPPDGVTATPAGLAVVGVELVNGLEAGRRTLSLIALGLALVVLVVLQRRVARSLLVLVPVAVAVGLSSLAVAALGIELTPLTTVAGPLVIAVGTEFSVLVAARYREERERGCDPATAVRTGVPRIGRAFVASGLTLVGGFGVLAFSPMPLLRDFGVVVALAVVFALASTLVVLPPLLVWADRRTGRGTGPGTGLPGPRPAEPAAPARAPSVTTGGER